MPPQAHTSSHSKSSKRNAKDKRMTIDNLLYGPSSRQSSTSTYETFPQISPSMSSSPSLSLANYGTSGTAHHSLNSLEGFSLSASSPNHALHNSNTYNQNQSHSSAHLSTHSLSTSHSRTHQNIAPESSSIITARRDFVIAITRPSTRRGYLECRLCNSEVWGPNG